MLKNSTSTRVLTSALLATIAFGFGGASAAGAQPEPDPLVTANVFVDCDIPRAVFVDVNTEGSFDEVTEVYLDLGGKIVGVEELDDNGAATVPMFINENDSHRLVVSILSGDPVTQTMTIFDEVVTRDCLAPAVPGYTFVTDCNADQATFIFTNDGDEITRMAATPIFQHFATLDVLPHSSAEWRTHLEIGETSEFTISADREPIFVGDFTFDCPQLASNPEVQPSAQEATSVAQPNVDPEPVAAVEDPVEPESSESAVTQTESTPTPAAETETVAATDASTELAAAASEPGRRSNSAIFGLVVAVAVLGAILGAATVAMVNRRA